MFKIFLGLIYHWKGLDLESTEFEYHHAPTHPQLKLYHLKTQILKHVEIKKFQIKLHMIHPWKGLALEITDFEYHYDPTPSAETIPSQTSNPYTVEIIKLSDKHKYVTSLGRS